VSTTFPFEWWKRMPIFVLPSSLHRTGYDDRVFTRDAPPDHHPPFRQLNGHTSVP